MKVSRRTALQQLMIITAGTALFPYCRDKAQPAMVLKNINISAGQQEMLAELCETIIPKTNSFLGAKDLNSHAFLLTMIDDCAKPEDQKIFMDGLQAFETICDRKFGDSFTKCSAEQRRQLLKELETVTDEKNPEAKFYRTCKGYTLQSFTTCKEYLLDVKGWKLAPGSNFKGCVKV